MLNVSGSVMYQKLLFSLVGGGIGIGIGVGVGVGSIVVGSGCIDIYLVIVGVLVWEIDLFGCVCNLMCVQQEVYFVFEENCNVVQVLFVVEIVIVWLMMVFDQDWLKIVCDIECVFGEMVKLIEVWFNGGIVFELEVCQVCIIYDQVCFDIVDVMIVIVQD